MQEIYAEREAVRGRFPGVAFPDPVLEPIWYGRRPNTLIDGKKAIVDNVSGKVFNTCSDQYRVIHYEDVVGMVEDVIKGVQGYGKIEVKPLILSDGGKMRIGLTFPEAQHLIRTKDSVVPKVEVFTSYDLSYRLMGKFGAFQLRCTNGMGTWKHFKQFARKHLQTLNLADLKDTILEGMDLFGIQVDYWKKWAETALDQATYDGLWEELPFSMKEKEKIEALPQIGDRMLIPDALKQGLLTIWDFSSILTQFNTHEVKSELRKIDNEPEIARIMEKTYDRVTMH